MARLLISAAGKSSGKTTLSMGLLAAWRRHGIEVQPFKKGPDYIDPKWLARATGKNCYNLDFNVQSHDEIQRLFQQHTEDLPALVEANKGLYDGLSLDGNDSNAALAKLLQLPVVLVIDCEGMTRGIAPLLQGYQAFDEAVDIAGVVLNKVGGARHESKLCAAIKEYVGIPVLGAVMKDVRMVLPERHLGLIPDNEMTTATDIVEAMSAAVEAQVDCNAILEIAQQAKPLDSKTAINYAVKYGCDRKQSFRLGIFRDAAFGFYYPDDLTNLEQSGAELIFIDSLSAAQLPDVDALFIGGGFPEMYASQLEANHNLRNAVKDSIEKGMPVYAECGGLMYLSQSLTWLGRRYDMVGVLPVDTVMHSKPQGRGYVKVRETDNMLWPQLEGCGSDYPAHEFHYSSLEGLSDALPTAFEVLRGTGIGNGRDGIVYKNLLATYTHQRTTRSNPWACRFAAFVCGINGL